MRKIGVGMAGFGKGGRIYNAPVIASLDEYKIKKILTSSRNNIEAANSDFPQAEVVGEYDKILKDPEIEMVVITTPNHFHKDFAERALSAGKHVVVEKPFTPSVEEAKNLIQLAKKQNRVLSINHNRRFDSDFLTIRNLLKEKSLGEIVLYEAHFDRFRNEVNVGWKENNQNPGSGILYDLGSHLIDQALVLFGDPLEIFADIRIQRKGAEVPDYFGILLFYPNHKVSLNAGMLVKEKGPAYSIHGTKGSFVKYGDDPQEEELIAGNSPKNIMNWGVEPKKNWGKLNIVDSETFIESECGDYRIFYKNIYKAITEKVDLLVTPEEAMNVIKIIELAVKSNAEKRRIIY